MSRRPRWWAIGRILVLALILHGVFLGYPFVRLGQWLGLEGPVWLLLAALIFFSQLIFALICNIHYLSSSIYEFKR